MDLRIQKTYRSLLTAFTKLLEKHRYEDVSVAMLCEEAMIRRTTFYKHFADKSEFFSFFVDSLRIELVKYGEARAEELRLAKGESAEDDPLVVNVEEGIAILRALVDFLLEHAPCRECRGGHCDSAGFGRFPARARPARRQHPGQLHERNDVAHDRGPRG